MNKTAIRILWIAYFICVIPSIVTLFHRHQMDEGFKSVALIADYFQLVELAQTENTEIGEILDRVKEAGVNDLAVLEDTPEFLELRGICTVVEGVGWPGWLTPEERDRQERIPGWEPDEEIEPDTDWPLLMGLRHDMTHLIFSDPDQFQRVAREAETRYPDLIEITDNGGLGGVVSVAGEPKIVMEWGFGFDPVLVNELRSAGFTLHPRLKNYPGYSDEAIGDIVEVMSNLFRGGIFIPDGDSVTGYPGKVGSLAESLIGGSLDGAAFIEFAEQKGGAQLAELMPTRTVRVHSIEDEEMEVVTVDRAIARYLRAVRERNIRLVYLKPFLLKSDSTSLTDKTMSMFSGVRTALESEGFTPGTPSIIRDPVQSSLYTRMSTIAGYYLALILLIVTLGPRTDARTASLAFLAIAFLTIVANGIAGFKVYTLGVAVFAGSLSVAWLAGKYQEKIVTGFLPLAFWAGAIAISLAGGLMIAGSFISTETLLQIDSFSGVKLALYFPILFALVYGIKIFLPPEKQSFKNILSYIFTNQVKIWHIAAGLFGLIALLIMSERSGNFPLIPVSDVENDIRGLMEQIFAARPRTKEFLIGYPALMIGLYTGYSRFIIRREFIYGGLVVGAIGLSSMVNTFCHIHTPIELTVLRTILGIIIGGIIGLIASFVITWIFKLSKMPESTV